MTKPNIPQRQKILIVDDRRENLFALRQILREVEAEVIEAGSGNEALAATLHHDFAVAILDVQMPEMSGYELAEYLRGEEKTAKLPIIFLTAAYGDEQHIFKGYEAGGVDYITKPYSPRILLSKLKIFLEIDRNRQELLLHRDHLETLVAQRTAELEEAMAEQRRAEAEILRAKIEWERTFEAIGDIAMLIRPDLRIFRVNRQATLTFATPAENLLGRYCYEVFRGVTEPCPGCPAVEAGRDCTVHSAEIEHQQLGKVFQVTASPVLDRDGRVLSLIHFAKDITSRKELENRLSQAQKLEAIGTLAGGIAHDFNNILTPILGYAEMAQFDLGPDHTAVHQLQEVVRAALRAKDLVQQILTFSRQKKHELLPLSPHLIIKEALRLLRASIPTSIEIRQNIHPNSGMVLADSTQIHQIIMNLCTNAYHAMREKGGVLTVLLRPEKIAAGAPQGKELPPGEYVLLEVSDTGCGIAPQNLAKIFDPYFTTKKHEEGTGLGLSVVHGIVKECGGQIVVSSEPGQGSTFQVYLPRLAATPAAEPPPAPSPLPRGEERILVVDDDPTIVTLNRKILEPLGYQVTGVTGSQEALRLFREAPQEFDLVLTDMTMPELNGVDLSQRLHELRPELPVILCSGFSTLIDSGKAKELGIQEFLMKPVPCRILAETVRRALDRRTKTPNPG